VCSTAEPSIFGTVTVMSCVWPTSTLAIFWTSTLAGLKSSKNRGHSSNIPEIWQEKIRVLTFHGVESSAGISAQEGLADLKLHFSTFHNLQFFSHSDLEYVCTTWVKSKNELDDGVTCARIRDDGHMVMTERNFDCHKL
jgi:hypothetical protein